MSTSLNSCRIINFVYSARKLDEANATSIAKAASACILRNPHNSDAARMKRAVGRQVRGQKRRSDHQALNHEIEDVRTQLSELSGTEKSLRAHLKTLNEQKKDAGRAPRNLSSATASSSALSQPAAARGSALHRVDNSGQQDSGAIDLELVTPPFTVPSNWRPPSPDINTSGVSSSLFP